MKNNKVVRIFIAVIVAVVLAIAAFIGGFFAGKANKSGIVGTYDWVTDLIIKNYVGGDVTEEDIKNVTLEGINSLLDRYSTYYTAEEYAAEYAQSQGSMKGIGVSFSYIPEGASELGSVIHIEKVVLNSPAFESGLKEGTFVTGARVGEETTLFDTLDSFSAFMSALPDDEDFTLITDRGEYTMARRAYTASYCIMSTAETTYSVTYQGNFMNIVETDGGISYLPEDTAYLRLTEFYGNAVQEFSELVRIFNQQGCTSLILDLRGNGGGYVDEMFNLSGIFLGQLPSAGNVAMSAKYKNGRTLEYAVKGVDDQYTLPASTEVKVLADNGTASASEALMGVLISNDVISYDDVYLTDFSEDYLTYSGTTQKNCSTYGKGIMQQTFVNRSSGEALKLTVAKIYWPDGTCIHDRGIRAEDGCHTLYSYWSVTYGDEQLKSLFEGA